MRVWLLFRELRGDKMSSSIKHVISNGVRNLLLGYEISHFIRNDVMNCISIRNDGYFILLSAEPICQPLFPFPLRPFLRLHGIPHLHLHPINRTVPFRR